MTASKHGRQLGVLADRYSDQGIRNTLPGQMTHENEQKASNPNPAQGQKRQPDVYCWCGRKIVRSTWERIKQGIAETCGASNCHAPEQEEETTNA